MRCVLSTRVHSLYTMLMFISAVAAALIGTAVTGVGVAVNIATFVTGRRQGHTKGILDARAAADAARAADLAVKAQPSTDQPSRQSETEYRFRVTNVGGSAARHLTPLLVDADGKVWSRPLDPMLLERDKSATFTLRVLDPSPHPKLYLDYTWLDDWSPTKQRRERSNVDVPQDSPPY